MKNPLKIIILLMLVLGAAFLIFGHIDIYNEQTLAEINGEYLGTAEVAKEKNKVTFNFMEPWQDSLTVSEDDLIDSDKLSEGMTVHVFADLAYVTAHEEKRTIISGRLKAQNDEEFYRIMRIEWQPLTLNNIEFKQTVDRQLIRWQEDRR